MEDDRKTSRYISYTVEGGDGCECVGVKQTLYQRVGDNRYTIRRFYQCEYNIKPSPVGCNACVV